MIKAIILDMDGLMIDSEIISYTAYGCYLKKYGVQSLSKEEYCYCFAGKSLVNGLLFARNHFQLSFDIDEACQFFIDKEHEIVEKDGVALKPGLRELLEYIKENNLKVSMGTSSGLERVHQLIDRHDIIKYFDAITCGSEVQNGKPAPDIFLKACEKLGVNPSEALVLEDSETGILAAHNGNIPVICIPDMKKPSQEYAEMTVHVYDSLLDVVEYLKGENK